MGKEIACNAGDIGDAGLNPWIRKILWRSKWQPTPVFLPRESHGQRSLAGCSPWGHKELDTNERLNTAHVYTLQYPETAHTVCISQSVAAMLQNYINTCSYTDS